MKKHTPKTIRRASAVLLVTTLLLTGTLAGCSTATTAGSQPSADNTLSAGAVSDRAQTSAENNLANLMSSATVEGSVVDFDSTSITVRPQEGDDEVAKKSLQDIGTDQTYSYTQNTSVSLVHYDRTSGTSSETAGSTSDIKIDNSVLVWLDSTGSISKIVVLYLA